MTDDGDAKDAKSRSGSEEAATAKTLLRILCANVQGLSVAKQTDLACSVRCGDVPDDLVGLLETWLHSGETPEHIAGCWEGVNTPVDPDTRGKGGVGAFMRDDKALEVVSSRDRVMWVKAASPGCLWPTSTPLSTRLPDCGWPPRQRDQERSCDPARRWCLSI